MVDVDEIRSRYYVADFLRKRFAIPDHCTIRPGVPEGMGRGGVRYNVFEVIEKMEDGSENLKRYTIERCLISEIVSNNTPK